MLKQHVDDQGMVNYKALSADRAPLDRYVESLAPLPASAYAAWDDNAKIAFWLNVYNALTLQTIIDHYPIQSGGFISGLRFPANSIRQIQGAWDVIQHNVMGTSMTLDMIEHATLRKQFMEPRIHMALVCAAQGCPPLRNEPFAGERLDAQLDDQARRFVRNTAKVNWDQASRTLYLSSIFKWFGEDFAAQYQTSKFAYAREDQRPLIAFAAQYLPAQQAQALELNPIAIEFLDYDWTLNEQ